MDVRSKLNDVPETMLWTLHNRATEAMRSDGIIKDEKAISIYQSINYDYQGSFGKAEPSHAVRSLDFDRAIIAFLKDHSDGVIVNLGEGLETQRYRIDDADALWLTVDLPESIEVRERFIQPDDRHKHVAVSATDLTWFDYVPENRPVFIAAQGLFMYFSEDDVKALLRAIQAEFDQWVVMFDTIPEWLSNKTMSEKGWVKTSSYVTPKMPWGINQSRIDSTINQWFSDNVKVLHSSYSEFPRGLTKWFFMLSKIPFLRNLMPAIVKITPEQEP